jgi:hypothetical protein
MVARAEYVGVEAESYMAEDGERVEEGGGSTASL